MGQDRGIEQSVLLSVKKDALFLCKKTLNF